MSNLLLNLITTLFLLSAFTLKLRRYQTVEHIVLFKVKPNISQAMIDDMVAGLNNLKNMNGVEVLDLSSGPVYRVQSSTLNFTTFLHSRYNSVEDLEMFMANPQHLDLVHEYTDPLTEDYMIVNYVVHSDKPLVNFLPGSAIRVLFLKLKEGVGEREEEEEKVLEMVREGGLEQNVVEFTCGGNYDKAGKGYQIASLAVFDGVKELNEGGSIEDFSKKWKERVNEFVDDVFVVDYAL